MTTEFITTAAKGALLITVLLATTLNVDAVQDISTPTPKRVLFIGNSYTSQIRKSLMTMRANSPWQDTTFEFITRGGATLQQHLANTNTIKEIKSGKWNFVVLQEQSQTPALPGKHTQSFQSSVDEFCKVIRTAGAKPVLYMTWGRRDGDQKNPKYFPNYKSMQNKLTDAYQSAAKRNNAVLAPVGTAWSVVRERDKELGRELYKKDGSHPSTKGACLASSVLFQTLFHDPLKSMPSHSTLTKHEWSIIKNAITNGR